MYFSHRVWRGKKVEYATFRGRVWTVRAFSWRDDKAEGFRAFFLEARESCCLVVRVVRRWVCKFGGGLVVVVLMVPVGRRWRGFCRTRSVWILVVVVGECALWRIRRAVGGSFSVVIFSGSA